MCMTDYDPPEGFVERVRKARKSHNCCECGREIQRGERYNYASGIWEGRPDAYKTCQHCDAGVRMLIHHCNGYVFEMVEEDLREHISEVLPWSMQAARQVVGMRRKWKRFDGAGLMVAPVFSDGIIRRKPSAEKGDGV